MGDDHNCNMVNRFLPVLFFEKERKKNSFCLKREKKNNSFYLKREKKNSFYLKKEIKK
jgi:hypothetical protein